MFVTFSRQLQQAVSSSAVVAHARFLAAVQVRI